MYIQVITIIWVRSFENFKVVPLIGKYTLHCWTPQEQRFEMAVGGTIFIDVEGVAARCSVGFVTSRQVALTRRCVSRR